jgi:hypothetical protein
MKKSKHFIIIMRVYIYFEKQTKMNLNLPLVNFETKYKQRVLIKHIFIYSNFKIYIINKIYL